MNALATSMKARRNRTRRFTDRLSGLVLGCSVAMAGLGVGCGYTQPVPGEPAGSSSGDRPSRPDRPWYGSGSAVRLDADREACELALSVTRDIEAPDRVWRTIREDLQNIRQFWSVTMPEIRDITFRPPYQATALVLVLDFGAGERVRERSYHEWDELNRDWGAEPASIRDLWDGGAEVTLISNLCVDMTAAIDDYRFLFGVDEVYPPRMEEDGPTLFVDYDDFERRYLFRDAWGTCDDGCDETRFAFFKISGIAPHFRETYDPQLSETPGWWPEASEIMRQQQLHYRGWEGEFRY